jgi:Zn-dependent protease with chaperone function
MIQMTIAIDTTATLFRQPAAQAVAWALVQFVWQGTAIGAVTALALFVLRRGAADIRYVVASVGMALMLTMPTVTGVQKYRALQSATPAEGTTGAIVNDGVPVLNDSLRVMFDRAQVADPASTSLPGRSASSIPTREGFVAIAPTFLGLWLAGVTLLTLRLVAGWIWMQRWRTHGVRPAEPAWERVLAHLARRLHITRTVALLESTEVDVPTVIGWLKPVVLLPASVLAALSPSQLEAILAHELAHIRRHDYLVNLLQTVVETLLFYHPAVWWVSRRIRIERENCCDDLAVSLCGDPVAYANALVDLESLRSSNAPFRRFDRTAMAATGGSLLQRVRRLVGAPAGHAGVRPAWLAASAALLIVGGMTVGADGVRPKQDPMPDPKPVIATTPTAAIEPQIAAASGVPASPRPSTVAVGPSPVGVVPPLDRAPASTAVVATVASTPQSISQHGDDSHGNWSWSNNGEKLQAEYSGSFDFTDDDTDVRQMSPGGHLRISDGTWVLGVGNLFSGTHVVEISERNGQIEHRYFFRGSERPYEPEGRAWLRENLPKFVRNTGINAPARVGRLLKSGGVPAVLTEIGRLDGNYVRGIYYRELFKQATLSPEQYRQVLTQASSQMKGSNYELSRLLIALADRLPNDEASRTAYFNAASSLTGAYETGRVYSTMLKKGPANPQIVGGILGHLRTLHSDYEVSQVLLQIVAQQPLDAQNGALLLDVVAGMHGDYERGRVLTEFLKQNSIEGSLRAPFFRAVDAMHGAYERGQILQRVVDKSDAGPDTLKLAILSTRSMPQYETSRVLLATAKGHAITGDLRDAYVAAAERLGEYEQGRVMTALVRSERQR